MSAVDPAASGELRAVENVTEISRQKCPDHGVRWCPECDDPDTGYPSEDLRGMRR